MQASWLRSLDDAAHEHQADLRHLDKHLIETKTQQEESLSLILFAKVAEVNLNYDLLQKNHEREQAPLSH